MSQKELQRAVIFDRVSKDGLTLTDAVGILGMSYRQGQRAFARYQSEGASGLTHRLRGRPSTRRIDESFKSRVLELYETKYNGFGPTLASEKMAQIDGLTVNAETLRLWLVEKDKWTVRHRRVRHRQQRKRKAGFGELVQLDGSHHDWFEGRGPKCCLITLVDDAKGDTHLLFARDEGTFAVMSAVRGWIERYGIPHALYTDRLKTYLTDREPTLEEQLTGSEPQTQFGRACSSLGIRIIAARSPQAKGRVERKHRLTQDRLVKEMRLRNIGTIEEANAFVSEWLPEINARFGVEPADQTDMHRPVPPGLDLDTVFCRQTQRVVGNDWVIRHNNQYYQIVKQEGLPPSGRAVTVREWADGTLNIYFNKRRLKHEKLAEKPVKPKPVRVAPPPRSAAKPAVEHPWRQLRGRYPTDLKADTIAEIAAHYLGEPIELTRSTGPNL